MGVGQDSQKNRMGFCPGYHGPECAPCPRYPLPPQQPLCLALRLRVLDGALWPCGLAVLLTLPAPLSAPPAPR